MDSKSDLKRHVILAAQEYGIASVLFRNAIGHRLGLNITDIGCVNFLFIKGSSTPTELARYTGLTTGSTTAMLDRLEKAELIARKPNPRDRRGVIVEIDQRSREAVAPMVQGVQRAQSELLDSFSEKDLAAIASFLTRFTENVNRHARSIERRHDG